MELFLLYLWLKMDSIITIFQTTGVVSGFIFFVTFMFSHMTSSYEDMYKYAVEFKTKTWKKWIFLPITCFMIGTFLPSKTDVAVLVGGSYALDVAKSPEAAKLMTVVRGKANEILDEEIKKLNKEK